eukprot:scaffold69931_cov24-Tisochrysis_lutea.AAC.1
MERAAVATPIALQEVQAVSSLQAASDEAASVVAICTSDSRSILASLELATGAKNRLSEGVEPRPRLILLLPPPVWSGTASAVADIAFAVQTRLDWRSSCELGPLCDVDNCAMSQPATDCRFAKALLNVVCDPSRRELEAGDRISHRSRRSAPGPRGESILRASGSLDFADIDKQADVPLEWRLSIARPAPSASAGGGASLWELHADGIEDSNSPVPSSMGGGATRAKSSLEP